MSTNKMAAAKDENMKIAVKSASYNMILQVIFRVSTFCMNAIMLRYLSKEILGMMNVRLMLLYSTMLFISREAFRKACLSQNENESDKEATKIKLKRMINLTWLCSIVGLISSIALYVIWMWVLPQPTKEFAFQYHMSTILVAFSCIIELLAEPFWILAQRNYFFSLKVIFEGIYLALRCFLSTVMVVLFPNYALFVFGISFVIAATAYSLCYILYFWWYMKEKSEKKDNEFTLLTNFFDLLPDFELKPLFDSQYINLIASFYKQSMLKQFLTEGERYIMTIFGILTFSEQGVYDVINNLGSLAARFIFMPIEETYYTFFSKTLTRGQNAKSQKAENLSQAANSLFLVLKFVSLIGITILVFGYSYSYLLLDLYGGKILSSNEGPSLLRAYCLYVFIIAINGITECFMFASMSKKEVDQYNYKMLLFSCVFLVASLLLTKYMGSIGFIFANCLNMGLRIFQSTFYIKAFFKDTEYSPLSAISPSRPTCVMFIVSFFLLMASEGTFCCHHGFLFRLVHIGIGCLCLTLVLVSVYLTEHQLVGFIKSFVQNRKKKKEE